MTLFQFSFLPQLVPGILRLGCNFFYNFNFFSALSETFEVGLGLRTKMFSRQFRSTRFMRKAKFVFLPVFEQAEINCRSNPVISDHNFLIKGIRAPHGFSHHEFYGQRGIQGPHHLFLVGRIHLATIFFWLGASRAHMDLVTIISGWENPGPTTSFHGEGNPGPI